ncbi:MAG: hypothetical protein LC808_35390 [Actinobacteria bacterium]|nr:hypothetical protein [Actinomycetota bacterium]
MNRIFRSAIFYLVLVIAVVWVYNLYRANSDTVEPRLSRTASTSPLIRKVVRSC